MSKRSLILAACAILLFIASFLSLMVEKNIISQELDDLVNGKEPENNKSDEPAAAAETD